MRPPKSELKSGAGPASGSSFLGAALARLAGAALTSGAALSATGALMLGAADTADGSAAFRVGAVTGAGTALALACGVASRSAPDSAPPNFTPATASATSARTKIARRVLTEPRYRCPAHPARHRAGTAGEGSSSCHAGHDKSCLPWPTLRKRPSGCWPSRCGAARARPRALGSKRASRGSKVAPSIRSPCLKKGAQCIARAAATARPSTFVSRSRAWAIRVEPVASAG